LLFALRWLASIASVFAAGAAVAQNERDFKIDVARSDIEVIIAAGDLELPDSRVLEWVRTSARAVAAYYGRFPVSRVRVLIVPVAGIGIKSGKSFGYGGAAIRVSLGRETTAQQLDDDWVMPHEMVHLAFPSVPDAHTWIEEGLATYVEPWARLLIGEVKADKVWAGLVDGLPKGLPREGDLGLDRTPTWGRTYWGGALFCLLADVEIRERTNNEKSLQDALRAIVAAGGNIEQSWELKHAIEIGDAAVGTPVLSELYQQMRDQPVATDLSNLWTQLGIVSTNGVISFDDLAPLAHVRRAMTEASAQRPATPDEQARDSLLRASARTAANSTRASPR
jgi:hypothetical protein